MCFGVFVSVGVVVDEGVWEGVLLAVGKMVEIWVMLTKGVAVMVGVAGRFICV